MNPLSDFFCTAEKERKPVDFWLTVAFSKGEGGTWQNISYICVGRQGGIDGLVFCLSLLERGSRADTSLIFGDGHDRVSGR